jgi:short-chain fatty acids transporter
MKDPARSADSRQHFTSGLVNFYERYLPDPFVLAIGLTVLVAASAVLWAPDHSTSILATSWYSGVFNIFGFAFQMIMILATGHALAHAPLVQKLLSKTVSFAKTPNQAVVLAFLISAAASWINWGFGLVICAMLSREIARHIRLDFAWLVGAAYSGWIVWASGPSGSIPLAQASPGNALNIVEKLTGHILPFSETIFTAFTLIPMAIVIVLIPMAFIYFRPAAAEEEIFVPPPLPAAAKPTKALSLRERAESSPVGSLLLIAGGIVYLADTARAGTIQFDTNAVIFIFILLGLALHVTPVRYLGAIRNAAAQTGAMMLLYPIYGGIMGIMTGTGLAKVISLSIANSASAYTLPLLSFLSSLFISFIVPSGGGHWAVQGPFTIPSAINLHASVAATTMAVSFGEQVANMLQPFWVLPVVSIAGIGIQRVLGFTTLSFLIGVVVYSAALLLLV